MKKLLTLIFLFLSLTAVALLLLLPPIASNVLLKPYKRPLPKRPDNAISLTITSDEIPLKGWHFKTTHNTHQGTIIYLHGVASNKVESIGIADTFCPLGFDVVAFDSRAHGESGGKYCTYGYYEKNDLIKIAAKIKAKPIFLIGSSMGAAIALQAAPHISQLKGIVTFDTFSDLHSIIRDKVPSEVPDPLLNIAIRHAEKKANFHTSDVSPLKSGEHIKAPALIIHGAADTGTPPIHSQRVYESYNGKKSLYLVPGAGHSQSESKPEVWKRIIEWMISIPH